MTKVVLVNLWRVVNAYGGTEKVFFDMANVMVWISWTPWSPSHAHSDIYQTKGL